MAYKHKFSYKEKVKMLSEYLNALMDLEKFVIVTILTRDL